jgi:N-acetylglucosaminyldiphosphoundecaprenol N-acetyl-beta-D-mannosaminyltransferase
VLSAVRRPGAGSFNVLGVRVDAVQIPGVIETMRAWIEARRQARFIAVTGMHGVTEARHDPDFRRVLRAADLVVPDGMPLVWMGRLRGHPLDRRVYGPELMIEFFKATAHLGYRHFFYGGAPGVAAMLAERMSASFKGVRVAGVYSPPYRDLDAREKETVRASITRSSPDVLWVGLSTPKQEKWMFENRDHLDVPVMVGVGAAFDLNTGRIRQAPPWVRENGLEWLYRFSREPRRLWRRYLVRGPEFLWNVSLELIRLRRFD